MPKLGIHGIEPLVQPGHVFLRVLESAAHLFCECRLIGQGLRTITPARMPDRVAFPPPMRTQAMAPLGPALLQTSCEDARAFRCCLSVPGAQAGGALRCLFPSLAVPQCTCGGAPSSPSASAASGTSRS